MADRAAPLLVVVTGPPASGKTTVAEGLAERLGVAFLSKDTFKEALYDHMGSGDALEDRLDAAALAAVLRVADAELARDVPFIIESNFDARSDLGPVRALAERHDARLVQVHCTRPTESLLREFAERAASGRRHPGHGDEPEDVHEIRADLDAGRWEPLDLPGELVQVDLDAVDGVDVILDDVCSTAAAAGGVSR
jgi:predicted kinase